MAAITFPPTPTVNDIYTAGTRQWKWNGSVWATVPQSYVPIFSDTAPSAPSYGMVWVDTTTMISYFYYGNVWVEVENSGATGVAPAGSVLQTAYAENIARIINGLGVIPTDDTTPQISEGTEILSLTITPSSVSSKILLSCSYMLNTSGSAPVAAIFRSNTTDALTCGFSYSSNYVGNLCLEVLDAPSSTSSLTYSVRCGCTSINTGYLNCGTTYYAYMNYKIRSTLVAQEIKG